MKYSVKAAARATGVTESALRTWERRYGVPRPGRSSTGRRQYGEPDLDLIRRMAGLVRAGIPASEAAAAVLTEGDPLIAAPMATVEMNPQVDLVIGASLRHDEVSVVNLLREAITALGIESAITQVFMGSLREIGGMWTDNRVPSATEHFLTELVRREICHSIAEVGPVDSGPSVVLTCPQGERHDVGLLALSLLLRIRNVRVCYLGSDVPTDDLIGVLRSDSVGAVCIAATIGPSRASVARAAREIVKEKLDTAIFVGGPAFLYKDHEEFVPGIMLPASLGDAADMIASRVEKEIA